MQKKKFSLVRLIGATPVSRYILAEMFKNDRVMRNHIETLRCEGSGAFIFNRQDGLGYYKSMKVADVKEQFYQNIARIISLTKWTLHLYKFLKGKNVKVEWKVPRP